MCMNTPEQAETSPEVNQRQTSETTVPVAPDGGYGWVILVASFLVGFLVDGVGFSVGIFVLKFLDEFDDSKSKTSWIASVLNGMYMVAGMLYDLPSRKSTSGILAVIRKINGYQLIMRVQIAIARGAMDISE